MTVSQIQRNRNLNSIQLFFEIVILILFVLNIILGFFFWLEFVYFFNTIFTLIIFCLSIANVVFAAITNNNTLPFTITNVIMAFVTFIPFVGFFSATTGIIMSVLSIVRIIAVQYKLLSPENKQVVVDASAQVVDKLD